MAIRALSIREFDRFNSARATVARHTDRAVEWFADDAATARSMSSPLMGHLEIDMTA
jgi:hypothetical protein